MGNFANFTSTGLKPSLKGKGMNIKISTQIVK